MLLCIHVLQKLLSSFKGLETVQGYDGSQTVASLPGQCPAFVSTQRNLPCSAARVDMRAAQQWLHQCTA